MRFQCQQCLGIVAVDDSALGQSVACGHCESVVEVPASFYGDTAAIDDFVIKKRLGKGGMGEVYLAHQLSLDREVALKLLLEEFSSNQDFVVDFVREARAAARLNHPNVIQSFAVGQENGTYFLAMECVKGQTLKEWMDDNGTAIPVLDSLIIIKEVASALGYAWNQEKLIHRDIKPDNIMLNQKGQAKLMDLGLARFDSDSLDANDDGDEVMGTPQYISPEQLIGGDMDFRGDLYSLGATFYHMITNQFPFDGAHAADIARKHLQEELVPPSQVAEGIPKKVDAIIVKMMAKHPDDRHATVNDLVEEIDKAIKHIETGGKTSTRKFKSSKTRSNRRRSRSEANTKTSRKIDVKKEDLQQEEAIPEAPTSSLGLTLLAGGIFTAGLILTILGLT